MSRGYPILFENMLIRKMLDLADINKDDVFYDLGSGYGQNLIIAASEFKVRDCIGIENKGTRFNEALTRVRKRSLTKQITLVQEELEYVDLEGADVVFYGLSPDSEIVDKFINNLKKGCKLIFYSKWPLPAIKPIKIDYPFYLAKAPIREAKGEREWLISLTRKNNLSTKELWHELYWKYEGKGESIGFLTIHEYDLRTVKKVLRERLKNVH